MNFKFWKFGFGKSGLKFLVSKIRSDKSGQEISDSNSPSLEMLEYKDVWRSIEPHVMTVSNESISHAKRARR